MADFQCHAIQLRKYAKTLAKIQFSAIFHMRDIQRNILPKFIEICLEKPCCWMVTNMTAGKRKHLSPGFATASEFISQGTHKHKST